MKIVRAKYLASEGLINELEYLNKITPNWSNWLTLKSKEFELGYLFTSQRNKFIYGYGLV